MEFRDLGIIIGRNNFSDNASIITLFTEKHGVYSGVVKQYSRRRGNILTEGNLVDFFWAARLHEHLGTAKCELVKSYSSWIIQDKARLYAFNSIACLIRKAFCEREPHNNFFPKFLNYLELLKTSKGFLPTDYIKLELDLLTEAGYGLKLDSCVVTGNRDNLCYVSPKSGQAVSEEVGKPYADKLLPLPRFLQAGHIATSDQSRSPGYCAPDPETLKLYTASTHDDIKQGFILTTYFLNRYILHGKESEARQGLLSIQI